ncbi:hypothetical protein BKA58DRAFT_318957 [Alternaria rosae]|uniref:uncharacterized protein n=1 Tax=Alternaria rosae TaxID=1187941 RepID=UPI001E8EF2B2|nr:uncharacterized protein BKA58DRAFT_318957 [Alternaria rosae]KAH6866314.1 hypothetical protein BKA58DRAFT_318957 [Alternaria rosae]
MTQPSKRAPAKRPVPQTTAPKAPPAPRSAKQPAKPKKEKRYPFDSHQDDIVVNSTELETPGYRRGVEHYRHQITLRKTYECVTTDFAEDMKKTIPKDALTPLVFESRDVEDGDTVIDYTRLPKPRTSRPDYLEYIYRATTTNPAVFLAILRVAERNLPFINFDSAITHLPNLPPNARLPAIPTLSALLSNPSESFKASKKGDMEMTILFLPHLYEDGRHAIGYYALAPEADPDVKQLNPEDVVQILFTPCTISDLVEAGRKDGDAGDEEELDIEYIEHVGARGGEWLERDVVEDWEEWCTSFRVARRVWEKVLKGVVEVKEVGVVKEEAGR